uniref:Uncharacterized protein KIAA0825-like n=1 Tax=Saccoglossus kowalevskii TaxID=10224 RepID=A0ABM0LV74_SACKO|nr:PREDICTED: uncharacterized protein KIAA0825-like [Saccoglossus kowalevskii]
MSNNSKIALHYKAPSVGAMFEHGIPSIETLQSVIKDIDQQLDDNSYSLEEKMHTIMGETNDMSGNLYITPREAVEQLNQCALLERAACLPPEPEDVNKLLRKILQTLDKYPGNEESIFQNLLMMSSQDGIAIPIRAIPETTDSTVSINAVTHNSEEMNETLWDEIRLKFRRFFYEELQTFPLTRNPDIVDVSQNKRWEYLQSLCILYPHKEVWKRYRSIRAQQLECIINNKLPRPETQEEEGEIKLQTITPAFQEVTEVIRGMISDDVEILMSGVFEDVVQAFPAIQELYLDRLSETIIYIIDKVWIYWSKENAVGDGNKTRANDVHKNKDAYHNNTGKTFAASDVECLVCLISSTASLDSYVDNLYKQTTWNPMPGEKPPKPKSSLRGVLKHNRESKQMNYSKEYNESGFSSAKQILLPDAIPPPFGVTQAMLSDATPPPIVPTSLIKMISLERSKWDWCRSYEKVIPTVAKGLTSIVENACHKMLREEAKYYELKHTLETEPVCGDLAGGKSDYPRRVTKSCATVIRTLDRFLPLAIATNESIFQQIKSAFTDAVIASFRLFYERITKINGDISENSPIQCLYITLATTSFLKNHLGYYEKILGEDARHVLTINQRLYSELTDLTSRNIMEYQNHIIATVVLQDAESHYWTDQRAFYEDERCSFAVQMWNYHMRGLHHDLFSHCGPQLAQDMFLSILNESLTILVQRCSKAKPSYNRVRQLRSDITTILLSTSHFLWSCSNTVSKLLDPASSSTNHTSIHNLCSCLLSTIVIVTSPLSDIYKAYKKGFHKKRCSSASSSSGDKEGLTAGHMTQWLSWLHQGVFEGQPKNLDNVPEKMASYILVKLVACQPVPNYVLVLQALLMKDAFLPMFIATHADPTLSQASTITLQPDSVNQGCKGVCCPGDNCATFESREISDVVQPFVDVLVLCKNQPIALSNVLMAMIEKDEKWEMFESSCIPGKTMAIPPWLECVYEVISPFIDRVIKPVVRTLIIDGNSKEVVPSFSEILKELPCGCKPSHSRSKPTGSKDPLFSAFRCLISKLTEEIPTLPTPVCVFFKQLQNRLQELGIKTAHSCIGLQIIASCLFNKLHDREGLMEVIGDDNQNNVLDNLLLISECIYHVLTTATYGNKGIMPKLAHTFLKVYCDWLPRQTEIIIGQLRNE